MLVKKIWSGIMKFNRLFRRKCEGQLKLIHSLDEREFEMIKFLIDKVVDTVTDKLKNDKSEALLGDADFVKKQWDDLSAIVDSALSEISGKVTKLQADYEALKARVDNWASYLEQQQAKPETHTVVRVVKRGRGRPRKVQI